MEKRKNIFDYLGQVFCIFGICILMMSVICILFGDIEKHDSGMFSLGSDGLPIDTILQFLGICAFTVLARFVFFTDALIKKLSVPLRTAFMFTSVIAVIASVIVICDWFPADSWEPWVCFFISFGVSIGVSIFIMTIRIKLENKQMEEALKKMQDDLKNDK